MWTEDELLEALMEMGYEIFVSDLFTYCKQCVGYNDGWCLLYNVYGVKETDYCSKGVRKESCKP